MAFTYTHPRTEMLEFVPDGTERVLDVGCSSGAFGEELRRVCDLTNLIGLEPNPDAAESARSVYDFVATGRFPEVQQQLPSGLAYEAIFFNDVLEHMVEPEQALHAARELLAPDGVIIASIPNIRHISVLGPLLVRDEFRYRDSGILDATHVRFFTARSIRRFFADNGLEIIRMEPINQVLRVGQTRTPSWMKVISKLARGRLDGFFTVQFVVVARVAEPVR